MRASTRTAPYLTVDASAVGNGYRNVAKGVYKRTKSKPMSARGRANCKAGAVNRKPNTYRAGKRKCHRCKVVWHRKKDEAKTICHRCRERCSRCDALLKDNQMPSVKKTHNICRACTIELGKISLDKDKARDSHLVRQYGITSVEYDAMLKAQGGTCWICEKTPRQEQRRLSVDHLHSKGENKRNPREKRGRVRGLLCWSCNAAIGKFKDNITHLRKAADYLESWPAQVFLKGGTHGKT